MFKATETRSSHGCTSGACDPSVLKLGYLGSSVQSDQSWKVEC